MQQENMKLDTDTYIRDSFVCTCLACIDVFLPAYIGLSQPCESHALGLPRA